MKISDIRQSIKLKEKHVSDLQVEISALREAESALEKLKTIQSGCTPSAKIAAPARAALQKMSKAKATVSTKPSSSTLTPATVSPKKAPSKPAAEKTPAKKLSGGKVKVKTIKPGIAAKSSAAPASTAKNKQAKPVKSTVKKKAINGKKRTAKSGSTLPFGLVPKSGIPRENSAQGRILRLLIPALHGKHHSTQQCIDFVEHHKDKVIVGGQSKANTMVGILNKSELFDNVTGKGWILKSELVK